MTKTMTLEELLTTDQIVETTRILNSCTDPIERVRRLADFYETFAEDLEKKGVLPKYLAYVVEYLAVEHAMQNGRNN